MRIKKFSKLAAMALTGGLVLGSGCSFNGLARNVWAGFGYALGGIPADLVTNLFLADLIDAVDGDNNAQ